MIKAITLLYIRYIFASYLLGFVLDAFLGDPASIPHPVQGMGLLIGFLEKKLLIPDDTDRKKLFKGAILAIAVMLASALLPSVIIFAAFKINKYVALAVMTVMSWQCIAAKSLKKAALEVYRPLKRGELENARRALSMIVGRNTAALDRDGITRAAVETVAENTNDGVICPLFYLAVGGPVLAFLYKSVSTMDSMIGYKNSKYLYFGRCAARLDDVLAFIPARISAVLMMAAAFVLGFFSPGYYSFKNAVKIFRRDRYRHASPNSAQCESVCAGTLGLRLAGPAVYFGEQVDKPYIGDALRPIEPEDIQRSCKLMYLTTLLFLICNIVTYLIMFH